MTKIKSSFWEKGLSEDQVIKLQEQHGRNTIEGKPPPSDWEFLFAQFKNPLVAVLVAAALVTLFLEEYKDSMIIGIAIAVNTILGFVQERKAYKSLEALKNVLSPEAMVTRDGKRIKIDAHDLVPGDVVWLYEGDKVPADGVLVENNGLLVNEAMLTGESVAVAKTVISYQSSVVGRAAVQQAGAVDREGEINAEQRVFMGTVVAGGSGKFIVTDIGMQTEMGKIAQGVEDAGEEETPLEKRLKHLSRVLTVAVVIAAMFVFGIGVASGREIQEVFTVSVALAVAAIPEGLVVALTVILAIGMQRILKRKAVVRTLMAAETLGTVTCVCVDKTGTLTEGKMQVVETKFEDESLGFVTNIMANDERDGNEIARMQWAEMELRNEKGELRIEKVDSIENIREKYPRNESLAFSSDRGLLAVRSGKQIFISGIPEKLIGMSVLSKAKAKIYLDLVEKWASQGRRLIGLAQVSLRSEEQAIELMKVLKDGGGEKIKWVGVVALEDPVRKNVKEAIANAQRAGVMVKVITGDYRRTAISVMSSLGIRPIDKQVLEGKDLEHMSEDELASRVQDVVLFARTKPQQKLQIVQALKKNNHVVGMMGDGVNDAPALATADIGMVVGDATEVAREASDMVLLDSNFNTILAAIEEGRGIFDNLRKVIMYLLSDTFSELIIIIGSLLMGWPLPITAAQILWINLVDDGLPSLALMLDPKAKDLLRRKPISPKAPLINGEMGLLIGVISTITAVSCLFIFNAYAPEVGYEYATTMVFAVLSVDSLLYLFSCRSLRRNIWEIPIRENFGLGLGALGGLLLTVLPIYVPFFQELLGLVPLPLSGWAVVAGVSLIVLAAIEAIKWWWIRYRMK